MEKEPIVNADKDKKPDFYNDVLSKRIRPKVTIEETEMKNQGKDIEPNKNKEELNDPGKGKQRIYSTEEAMKASTVYFHEDNICSQCLGE